MALEIATNRFTRWTIIDHWPLFTLLRNRSSPCPRTLLCFHSVPCHSIADVITLSFFVDIPGAMPLTGFTSSGTNSDDTVGTVGIPVVMTVPVGPTNRPQVQSFPYTIDNSSTAEYGVDYKMHGGIINFYGGYVPSPFIIPLTIIHDGIPKNKTVIIKFAPGNSIACLGPISTFTYTISDTFPVVTLSKTNNSINLTWPSVPPLRTTPSSQRPLSTQPRGQVSRRTSICPARLAR